MLRRSIVSAALAFALGTACAARANPPVEAFGDLPLAAEPKLSPDGRHFAAIQSVGGRPAVAIYATNAPADAMPKVVGSSTYIVVDTQWVKNDRLFITANANVTGGTGRIHAWFRTISVDTDGENSAMMFANSTWRDFNTSTATVYDIDLDDPTHVFMPLYVPTNGTLTLYRVDARTGAQERLMQGSRDTERWFMDGHGQVVGRLDGSGPPFKEYLSVPDKGDWRRIGSYDAAKGHSSGVLGLSEDGKSFVRAAQDPDTGFGVLLSVDPADGATSLLHAEPKFDIDDTLSDPWTDRVIGVSYADQKREYAYLDPAMEALQRGLEAAFKGKSVHAVSWNTAKDQLIVAVDGPRAPLSYYYLDRNTHAATRIVSTRPQLKEEDLGEMKPYPYKARDGLDIPAYLTLPPGKEARNLPAVILPHGGPMARDELGFDWTAAFFANRGYAVLQPNFRGSSGYGTKFLEAGYGQWGLKMQDDVSDGVKKLVADGIVDPKRVCIVGASYGGYAALEGAASTPELYACAIGFAGVYDLPKFLGTRAKDYGADSWMIESWQLYIGNRYDDAAKLAAASPARHADAIRCPVLLMHGKGDTTVRIDQSEAMRDALKRAGKDVTFIQFDADSHYMLLADTRIRFLKEAEAFLEKTIGH